MSSGHTSHPDPSGDLESIYARALQPYAGPLDASVLCNEAEQATKLSDWGGDRWAEAGFRQRFAALCSALETEANLTPVGRSRAHGRVHAMLCSRLRVIAYRRHWSQEPDIRAPLVGTGLPRSGTSFLQALLAQDPENLVPITAHGMVPVPPPGELADEAQRMKLVARMLTFQGLDAPEVNAIHPIAPDAEDEDVLFQEAACGSLYQGFFNVPSFAASLWGSSGELYAWQKGMMQLMQSGQPGKRWVLKAPEYMAQLGTLRAAYPDACIFVNHRDPAKVIPSIASLHVTFQGLNCESTVDTKYLGPPIMAGLAAVTQAMTKWRLANPDVRVVDVQYKQLVADPIGEAGRVYGAFGLDLSLPAKERMESFLNINRHGQGQGGVIHRYELGDYGLDEGMIDDAFADYMERYKVQRER